MNKTPFRLFIVYAVTAVIHLLLINQFPAHLYLPASWIGALYSVLAAFSVLSTVIIVRVARKRKGAVGNIFLVQSLVKFFVVVLFLVVMIKLSGVSGRTAIVHLIPAYFIGLAAQTILVVKRLNKS